MNRRQVLNFDLSYWYILALHVLYAAVFFPFRTTYAIEYFQHAKGLNLQQAGVANSWVFFTAIFATPFFGLLADKVGYRALMLMLGTLLLPLTFVVLGLTNLNLWVSTAMMGISFALVPAIIWPATTLIVEPHRLGTALGLITLIQALAMAASNLAGAGSRTGRALDRKTPSGYSVMLWFFFLLSLHGAFLGRALVAPRAGRGPRPRRRAQAGDGCGVADQSAHRCPWRVQRATPRQIRACAGCGLATPDTIRYASIASQSDKRL